MTAVIITDPPKTVAVARGLFEEPPPANGIAARIAPVGKWDELYTLSTWLRAAMDGGRDRRES